MFTQQLSNVYTYAKRYARIHSTYVHTGHYLDGLLSCENSVKKYLNEFGIHRDIFSEINYGTSASPNEAEAVRLKASAISNQLGSIDCDCEHLMLAIFSVESCYAYKFLTYNMPDGKKISDLCAFIASKIPNYDLLLKKSSQPQKVVVAERISSNPFGSLAEQANKLIYESKPQPQIFEKKKAVQQTQQAQAVSVQEQAEELSNQIEYCTDLTEKAREGKFDPIIGRDDEIQRVIQSLTRRTKNNPVLIGEAGVGKSAIIEGLAQVMVKGKVPSELSNKRILELDIAGMVAGSRYRGDFEERFKNMLSSIGKSDDVILFIDEIHNLVGAGSSVDKSMDAAEMLKPLLARGVIRTIGATTVTEYRKSIEKDPALERRFQPILINQPTPEQAVLILKGVKSKYEQHHDLYISDEAIEAAVELSTRYLPDRSLPDKAFDILDEACSMAKLLLFKEQGNQTNLKRQKIIITFEHIASVVSLWTGIPLKQLCQTEKDKLLNLENLMSKRVIGQSEAIRSVANAIRRARTGLKDPNRPIGSFIFVGPTGVGKTELAKALAECMFGSSDEIIRLDMSEYMEKQSSSKLIGAPPGYVGYDEGGQLTEKVRLRPYSVVLFDEIEKAHPDIFNLLLQILDEGHVSDSHGKVVDFKNTVLIMTSNLGSTQMADIVGDYDLLKKSATSSLKRHFRPEFLNRVDDIVVFEQLSSEQIGKITTLLCLNLAKRLKGTIFLYFTPAAINFLSDAGFDIEYGARPLKRAIQRNVEDILADKLLKGEILKGDKVTVTVYDGNIQFYVE